MKESKLLIRHFIMAEEFDFKENNNFNAKNIYEYISAKSFPSKLDFKAVLGVYFLNPKQTYNFEVEVLFAGQRLGRWLFRDVTVDETDEIMNFPLYSRGKLLLPDKGFIEFIIRADDEEIGKQYIKLVKEEVI